MVCHGCAYRFALDPKKTPKLSDVALKKIIDRISGDGEYHFTYNQLTGQLCRRFSTSSAPLSLGGCIWMTLITFGIGYCLFHFNLFSVSVTQNIMAVPTLISISCWLSLLQGGKWMKILTFTPICFGLFFIMPEAIWVIGILLLLHWLSLFDSHPALSAIHDKIDAYHAIHPISNMVTGNAFAHLNSKKTASESDNHELLDYAPDKILIVERNDIVDMLLLNRFHLENKILIVSQDKYPLKAFKACQQYLKRFPDLKIVLMHDASTKGLSMKKSLYNDPSWNLAGKPMTDLGLRPDHVKHLNASIWISSSDDKFISGGKPTENIENGFIMPIDTAPPKIMLSTIGGAALLGLPLLSQELMASQKVDSYHGFG